MCVICVKKENVKMPSLEILNNMFTRNPDGAGYMFVKKNENVVHCHKGFMSLNEMLVSLQQDEITDADVVVFHFRISTQANNPTMTHPFPLTSKIDNCTKLDFNCRLGIAHNGIIRMTSDARETRYNDTSIFITKYMTKLIRCTDDLKNENVLEMIQILTNSKWALLDSSGYVATIGAFNEYDGLLFSNYSWQNYNTRCKKQENKSYMSLSDYFDLM